MEAKVQPTPCLERNAQKSTSENSSDDTDQQRADQIAQELQLLETVPILAHLTIFSGGSFKHFKAVVRYSLKDLPEAVRLADGEAGQEKDLLDFSETSGR